MFYSLKKYICKYRSYYRLGTFGLWPMEEPNEMVKLKSWMHIFLCLHNVFTGELPLAYKRIGFLCSSVNIAWTKEEVQLYLNKMNTLTQMAFIPYATDMPLFNRCIKLEQKKYINQHTWFACIYYAHLSRILMNRLISTTWMALSPLFHPTSIILKNRRSQTEKWRPNNGCVQSVVVSVWVFCQPLVSAVRKQ